MKRSPARINTRRRRATTVILVLVTLPVILGFGALAVDVGVLYGTRADLQNAADAAALAGVSALTTAEMMQVRMAAGELTSVRNVAMQEVQSIAELNDSFGASQTAVEPRDVAIGWIDLGSATSPLQTGFAPAASNAVHVTVRRSEDSVNGPVHLFFAPIFGKRFGNVSASAVAAFDDRVAGYDTSAPGGGVLPLTMHIDDYDKQVITGGDVFNYDRVTDSVSMGADGTREVNVYPGDQAPGNFGLLNIGRPDQGLPEIIAQIENGVPPEDFERETGSAVLTFSDGGERGTYDIMGNPGLKTALEDSIDSRIGQVIAFFVHDWVDEGGANTVYRVVGMRFGRVMEASLQVSSASRGLWVQPVTYVGSGVRTSPGAPSSGGVAGRIVLAR